MANPCRGSDLAHGGRLRREISNHAEYNKPWPTRDTEDAHTLAELHDIGL